MGGVFKRLWLFVVDFWDYRNYFLNNFFLKDIVGGRIQGIKKERGENMKYVLLAIMFITGMILIIGLFILLTSIGDRQIDPRAGIIIGMVIIPFILSLGFYSVIDILEKQAKAREVWFEAFRLALRDIEKQHKPPEKRE